MLELTEEDRILVIRAGGKLTLADYDRFVPAFEEAAAREAGRLPMLIELDDDFAGWDLGGLWRDLKFDVKHKDSFGRIAVVGDKRWEEWGTKLSNPLFPSAEMRFFEREERTSAKVWLRS
ncbi:STAS/SEC14 domain-containing protein [Erythrobacter sp. 3-20A1M]|uniref:STAS/SEC14 domain-containing protein n=1 Tax=Erythrobacter sp. 3-20A1M TaxID=2653850 RepID=UPI001BFCC0EE|nr:STAS/SEC14 domain-containing protein [Erythrobacter sp. 3-20A1M]QWC58355.1 STAS/SEC14 domain-containing protein [Erythrobacter sp. 3-20A1M]